MAAEVCVVTDKCHNCKHTDCVAVCPVDCFYQDDDMLYIHPDVCIGCCLCIPECPEEAIFVISQVPQECRPCIKLNEDKAKELEYSEHNLTQPQEPKRARADCKPAKSR